MTTYFDKIRDCVEWGESDRERIAELRRWLDSDGVDLIDTLGEQLARLNDMHSLMSNARFVNRLCDTLREWLMGVLDETFDEEHIRKRRMFGKKLMEIDLTFDDIILLEGLAHQQLIELAKKRLDENPSLLLDTIHSLDKALNFDLALIYNGYLHARDAEIERILLDRFLTTTGFSRSLYENLTETQEQR